MLAFGLRACASFQEKLLQLGGKCTAKKSAEKRPFSKVSRRIRGKF
jgi:hypothetical protein